MGSERLNASRLRMLSQMDGAPLWGWPLHGSTCRMLGLLVEDGLVEMTEGTQYRQPKFFLTPAGRAALEASRG